LLNSYLIRLPFTVYCLPKLYALCVLTTDYGQPTSDIHGPHLSLSTMVAPEVARV